MVNCPKCGKVAEKDDLFCRFCGASLGHETDAPQKPTQPAEDYRYAKEPEEYCFGEHERHTDLTGLISFGIFLLIIGVIFVTNPNIGAQLNTWATKMQNTQMLSRPPQEIISSAVLFFAVIGLSELLISGIRSLTYKRRWRALRTAFSGIALITFSYLIYLYGKRVLGWQIALAYEILVIGLLVILYAIVRLL
ncbi:MAG TPA: zinc ribbon domain-containing protein [Candidatus Bathyarchaeia archaeon]|nr:zinc ribbon domain-containing protein [Candidatus Bathyarchaeia archaeon]